jgi:hypothetical protein
VLAACPKIGFDTPLMLVPRDPSEPYGPYFHPSDAPFKDHTQKLKEGTFPTVVTHPEDVTEREQLVVGINHFAHFPEVFGTDRALDPQTLLDDTPPPLLSEGLPPIFIIHGTSDTNVLQSVSERFIETMEEKVPGAKAMLALRTGEQGFDTKMKLEEE